MAFIAMLQTYLLWRRGLVFVDGRHNAAD